MKNLQEGVVEAALPLSFALGVGLGVLGTLAGPPLTGVLYLLAVLAGAGGAYVLLGARGQEEEEDAPTTPPRPLGKKRDWYEEAVEDLRPPEHADNGEATSY